MPGWRLGQGLQGAEGIWENLRDLGRGVSLQRGAWGGGHVYVEAKGLLEPCACVP